MVTLTAFFIAIALVFGPIIYWLNHFAVAKYGRPAFGVVQTIYVVIALVILFVGVGHLPKEFSITHLEPMSPDERALAKAEWMAATAKAEEDLATSRNALQTTTDPLDKKDAVERIKESEVALTGHKKSGPPTSKRVWTPSALLKFFAFPIARPLQISAWCFGTSLALLLGIFVYNARQMDVLTATAVFILQIALALPLLLLAVFMAKAFENKQHKRPILS